MAQQKFLIVVDMQNDFIDGSLGTKEALAIVPGVINRVRKAREAGETVIFTLDTHEADYLNTAEGKKLPVPHCIRGTNGHAVREEILCEAKEALLLEKPAFGSLRLPALIQETAGENEISIELIGLCTDICVISNALILKAHFPEAQISVRKSCCAGVTAAAHEAALTAMASCQIDII